ncbi:unnamed protein product, partial [Didymodactylos carnosus]
MFVSRRRYKVSTKQENQLMCGRIGTEPYKPTDITFRNTTVVKKSGRIPSQKFVGLPLISTIVQSNLN